MNNDPTDLISLLVALIAMLTGRELALLIGPYAAICVLACAGAGVALSSNEKEMSNWHACQYVAFRLLMAVVLTVGLAEFIQSYLPGLKPRYTLMPVAFMLGWIRDYNSITAWIGDRIGALVKRKTDE